MHPNWSFTFIGLACLFAVVHSTCVDKDKRCKGWAESGECEANPGYMLTSCKKSCKKCEEKCVDKDKSCEAWKEKYCESDEFKAFMRENCKKTCNLCAAKDEEPCDDKDTYCSSWAASGECSKNKAYMKLNCRKSCKLCTPDDCKDIHDIKKCKEWADSGECDKNPSWMHENCKKSCKKCQVSTGSVTSDKDDKIKHQEINDVLCGLRLRSHVVGGNATALGDWPWQIGLAWKTKPNKVLCGGSLINKQWAVTAAHCLQPIGSLGKVPEDYVVIIGTHDLTFSTGTQIIRTVTKIIKHSDYSKYIRFDNDIALIKLEKPIKYNQRIKPVCLPKQDREDKGGEWCYVTGWGRLGEYKQTSRILQEARMPIVNNSTCVEALKRFGKITNNMICAGYKEGKIDACQGDSGGPFVCSRGGRFELAGVVSWGAGCARTNRYGVYAKVSRYVDWIKTHLKNES